MVKVQRKKQLTFQRNSLLKYGTATRVNTETTPSAARSKQDLSPNQQASSPQQRGIHECRPTNATQASEYMFTPRNLMRKAPAS